MRSRVAEVVTMFVRRIDYANFGAVFREFTRGARFK